MNDEEAADDEHDVLVLGEDHEKDGRCEEQDDPAKQQDVEEEFETLSRLLLQRCLVSQCFQIDDELDQNLRVGGTGQESEHEGHHADLEDRRGEECREVEGD